MNRQRQETANLPEHPFPAAPEHGWIPVPRSAGDSIPFHLDIIDSWQ